MIKQDFFTKYRDEIFDLKVGLGPQEKGEVSDVFKVPGSFLIVLKFL